jgi:hypothetical protein
MLRGAVAGGGLVEADELADEQRVVVRGLPALGVVLDGAAGKVGGAVRHVVLLCHVSPR